MKQHVIVCHLYYHETIPKAVQALKAIDECVDIYITCRPDIELDVLREVNEARISAQVRCFENRGLDILPFLKLIPELSAQYAIVTKVHFKREDNETDKVWNCFNGYSFTKKHVLSHIERVFQETSEVNIIGAAPLYLSLPHLMLDNSSLFHEILESVGCLDKAWEKQGFFAGTTFSVKPSSILALCAWAKENESRFTTKNYQPDARIEHAVERVFTAISASNNKVGLLFDCGSSVFSEISKPIDKACLASTRDVTDVVEHLVSDLRDLTSVFEHVKPSQPIGSFIGDFSYAHYYLLFQQFQKDFKQFNSPRLLKKQRKLIDWSYLKDVDRVPQKVSIIVPVYNQGVLTKKCIDSLFAHAIDDLIEVIIVDNGSDEETKKQIALLDTQYDLLSVVTQTDNLNFSLGCNLGFLESRGEFVVFLNNDIEIIDDWLAPLVAPVKKREVFASQPLLLYPDHTIQCLGISFNDHSCMGYPIYNGLDESFAKTVTNSYFQAITAACICIRADDFMSVEGFSPAYLNGQEDVDLCFKLRRKTGLMAKFVHQSKLIHHESKTEGRFSNARPNRHIFTRRWSSFITPDDYQRYLDDGVYVSSWRLDSSSIPFWIKSAIPAIGLKEERNPKEMLAKLHTQSDEVDETLSMLFTYTCHNPAIASSFVFTLNQLLTRKNALPKQVTRTIIIAKDAFSYNHALAESLYAVYKSSNSSVGIVIHSDRKRISRSTFHWSGYEDPQTNVIYNSESDLQLFNLIQVVLSNRADNIHLVDFSFNSIVIAYLYKVIHGANIYCESLPSLQLMEKDSLQPVLKLIQLDYAKIVNTKGLRQGVLLSHKLPIDNRGMCYHLFLYCDEFFSDLYGYLKELVMLKGGHKVIVIHSAPIQEYQRILFESLQGCIVTEETKLTSIASELANAKRNIIYKPQELSFFGHLNMLDDLVTQAYFVVGLESTLRAFKLSQQREREVNISEFIELLISETTSVTPKSVEIHEIRDKHKNRIRPLKNNIAEPMLRGEFQPFTDGMFELK